MSTLHYLVPQHTDGTYTDLEHSISVNSHDDAEDLFVDAKDRLWNVNGWGGGTIITFRLTDAHGRSVRRNAHRNDHIRAGWGSAATEGEDWVVVEAVEYDDYPDDDHETFAIRVHPAQMDTGQDGYPVDSMPTGTFVVERRGRTLKAGYHGRNEIVHGDETASAGWRAITDEQWLTIIRAFIE